MSDQRMLPGFDEHISSPESRDGSTLSPSLDGQPTDPSGQGRVRASRSRKRAGRRRTKTKDISGQCSFGSSESADLQYALANRLMDRLDVDGSPEFVLTWRRSAMPSGSPVSVLRARARRTSDRGFTGLPTPKGRDRGRKGRNKSNRGGGNANLDEQIYMKLTGVPTPKQTDGDNGLRSSEGAEKEYQRKGMGSDLPTIVALTGVPTPRSMDSTSNVEYENPKSGTTLGGMARSLLGGVPTESARDWKDGRASQETMEGNSRPLNEVMVNGLMGVPTPRVASGGAASGCGNADRAHRHRLEDTIQLVSDSGTISTSSPARTGGSSVLNPAYSLWLMGYLSDWLMVAPVKEPRVRKSSRPSETPSSRKSRRRSSGRS